MSGKRLTMSETNSSNSSTVAENVEKKLPSVSLLTGDREVVVRDIPKANQGAWIVKNHGNFNSSPAINGWIFSRSAINAIRENVPGLTGDTAIYDPSTCVPVVFTTVAPKASSKDREKAQRVEFAKLGFTWNSVQGRYEAPISCYNEKTLNAITSFNK
jgi:hypothetical protein